MVLFIQSRKIGLTLGGGVRFERGVKGLLG